MIHVEDIEINKRHYSAPLLQCSQSYCEKYNTTQPCLAAKLTYLEKQDNAQIYCLYFQTLCLTLTLQNEQCVKRMSWSRCVKVLFHKFVIGFYITKCQHLYTNV